MPPPSQILPDLPTYFQVFEAGQLTLVQHSIVSEQAHAAAARNPARHHAAARHGGLYFLAHIDQKLLEDSGPAHHVLHRQGSIFFTSIIVSPPPLFGNNIFPLRRIKFELSFFISPSISPNYGLNLNLWVLKIAI